MQTHIYLIEIIIPGNQCTAPKMGHWENMTVTEEGTAIFRCPMDTVNSCIVQEVKWYRVTIAGNREELRDSRVEIFAFDPLLM